MRKKRGEDEGGKGDKGGKKGKDLLRSKNNSKWK